ncbi:DUF222 domain-containing protein [Pseudokineococcus basanitobsidens]|uniref:DUF222 domain-containing protein n=1 Tax=Pseudokineococcus basanitobsidens TaxID=1926649 RepID=A0ABU8RHB0_9ACTN
MVSDLSPEDLPLARREARAVVDAVRREAAEDARRHAAQLRRVAHLVELMGRVGGAAGDLAVDDGYGGVGAAEQASEMEVAAALHLTATAAGRLVEEALALTTDLPTTMAALEAGRVDAARARVVVRGTAHLPSAEARALDALLVDALGPLTTAQLAARIRYLLARQGSAEAARRRRQATRERCVRVFPLEDGMAQLCATGPAVDLVALHERLTTMAGSRLGGAGGDDPHGATAAGLDPLRAEGDGLPDRRSADARRFDALVDLVLRSGGPDDVPAASRTGEEDHDPRDPGPAGAGTAVPGPRRRAAPAGPQVVVALTSLAGLDDEPAALAGHGPVPVEAVRELLAAGSPYRRVLTDPWTGTVLGLDGHLRRWERDDDGGGPDPEVGRRGSRRRRRRREPTLAEADRSRRRRAAGGGSRVDHADRRRTPPPTHPGCPTAENGGAYRPRPDVVRFVRARVPTCDAPGCRRPATLCDLDHQVAWSAGGTTCETNLRPRCRRHHRAKHHLGWQPRPVTDDPRDTGTRWTSPLGLVHDVPATPLLPSPVLPSPPGRRDDDVRGSRAVDGRPPRPAGAAGERYPRQDVAAHDAERTRRAAHAQERAEQEEGEQEEGEQAQERAGGAAADRAEDRRVWWEAETPPF